MPTTPEFVIILIVVAIVFGIHKLSDISGAIARWRLQHDEEIAEDAIEVVSQNGDHNSEDDRTDPEPTRGV